MVEVVIATLDVFEIQSERDKTMRLPQPWLRGHVEYGNRKKTFRFK